MSNKDLTIEVPKSPQLIVEIIPPVMDEEKKPIDVFQQEQLSEFFIKNAYNHLEKMIGNGKITLMNAVGLTVSLMQYTETMKGVQGIMKKFVVMSAIKRYITEHVKDQQERVDLLIFADMTLPSMIDTFIQIDVKEIAFNVKKGVFACCCPNKTS